MKIRLMAWLLAACMLLACCPAFAQEELPQRVV